ncbi:retinol-binding protein pinta-like isoform X3 [Harmonia axyridis]|nr:retinol-binding protein pinta-like isoform X2 [Harmonia axyridis]XP_045465376.1 retinol-binding protein pinta-like isoform X3 [Harmonia axyridis]
MGIEKHGYSLLNPPNEEELRNLKKIMGEDEDKLQNQLVVLYKWLDSHPKMPKNYDKTKVMNFLRACKYDMEKCKRKLQAHFYIRHEFPLVYSNLNPRSEELTTFPKYGNALFLPNLTPAGERLFFLGMNPDIDPDMIDFNAYCKFGYMCYDLVLREQFPITGDIILMDGTGFTMKLFLRCINTAVKDSIEIAYKGYLIRLKSIYIVNAPAAVDKMVATWKLFLTEKIRNRVVVSKNSDILTKKFPLHCLPQEYGGTLPKINQLTRQWHESLIKNEKWFLDQESCKTSEPPKKEDNIYDDRFGVEGTFRKLTID